MSYFEYVRKTAEQSRIAILEEMAPFLRELNDSEKDWVESQLEGCLRMLLESGASHSLKMVAKSMEANDLDELVSPDFPTEIDRDCFTFQ